MNRQTFELLVLGSASASPTTERNVSGQLLNIAERYFLIDCGEATQLQLRRYKAKFQSIDHIFISHLHGDHFFGLPGLISSMHLLGRRQVLNIYGPPELRGIMEAISSVTDTRLNYPINWVSTVNTGLHLLFEDQKVEVLCFPLQHRIFCTGFLFREKPLPRKIDKAALSRLNISVADILQLRAGRDVVNEEGRLIRNAEATIDPPAPRTYAYCSDTIYDPGLPQYFMGADLLYHESTFLEQHAERAAKTFHCTARQAGQIAAKANAGTLLLGHFSARYTDLSGFIAEASTEFANCLLAGDGKKVKI